jgi:hypothetical protein
LSSNSRFRVHSARGNGMSFSLLQLVLSAAFGGLAGLSTSLVTQNLARFREQTLLLMQINRETGPIVSMWNILLGGLQAQARATGRTVDQESFSDWITPDTRMRLVFDNNLARIVTFSLNISHDIMNFYQAHADLCEHLRDNRSLDMENVMSVTGKIHNLLGLSEKIRLHRFYWPATFPAYFMQNVLTPPRG